MKETKLDKSMTFDKIYAMMMTNCFNKIKDEEIDTVKFELKKILTPTMINKFDDKYSNLIDFNGNFVKIVGPAPKLNEEEASIMKIVEEAEKSSEENKENIFNDKGLFFSKLKAKEEFILIGGLLATIFYTTMVLIINKN
jgi:AMMECR1 domain-containing protein